jgi:hypothetical protein
MKLITFGLILAATATLGSTAQAQLVPLSATGYNEDMIVENSAATPSSGQGYVSDGNATASMDNGTNGGGSSGSAYTLFESGLSNDSNGLPTNGEIGTSYAFQSYSGNNALLLNGNSQEAPSDSGTLTLTTPTSLTELSLFGDTGSAGANDTDTVVVHFADSTTEQFTATNITQDWYSGSSGVILSGLDRVDVSTSNTGIDTGHSQKFDIYADTFTLADPSPVTSVEITLNGPGNNAIYGISGALAVPEPGACALTGFGAIFLALFAWSRRRASV